MEGALGTASAGRDEAVRRNTRLLVAAQAALWGAAGVFVTVGPSAGFFVTGRAYSVGVVVAAYQVAAATALFTGRAMDRLGRRPGLLVGYGLLGLAGPGAAVSVLAGSFPGLILSTLLFGGGIGAALLGRAAVADMYPPDRRGRAVGRLLAGGTLGAVGAPPLVGGIQSLFEGRDAGPFVWPWLLTVLFAAVGLVCCAGLRPDPRDLAPGPAGAALPARRRSLGELLRVPPFAVALVSIAVAQALMVGLMGVAPITLRGRGGSALAVSLIISLHLAGMFVFSPLVGSILDRWGRRPSLFVGAALSGAGALAGSLGGSFVLAGAGLFLVGVGWSFAYLGATAVVSDVTTPAERAGGLGFTDLLTSLTAATGALTGGSLLQAEGFDVLGRTLAALVLPVFVLLLFVREIAPGRWAHVGELPTPVPQGAARAGAATTVHVPVPDAGAGCWLPATLPVEAGRRGGE